MLSDTLRAASKGLREDIAYFMRRLYRQQLTTTSGGNISARLGEHHVAITASKSDKAELNADQVGIVTLAGENLTCNLVLSIETSMHLQIYRHCPAVTAIVHAHPPTASAFSASTIPINTHLTAEAYALVREPVFIPYACMGTQDLAENVGRGLGEAVTALLENHGILAIGENLLQAFDRLEVLEVAARHTLITRQLGSVQGLSPEHLAELDVFMGH